MRELQKDERDLWTVVYDVCVKTPNWLELQPFHPGGLHIEALKRSKTKEEITALCTSFKQVYKDQNIDFELTSLMKTYPEVGNQHIYEAIGRYIDYFEEELPKLLEDGAT